MAAWFGTVKLAPYSPLFGMRLAWTLRSNGVSLRGRMTRAVLYATHVFAWCAKILLLIAVPTAHMHGMAAQQPTASGFAAFLRPTQWMDL
eukprot:6204730-Pleurochrysis_carterae.AAC.1